MAIEQALNIPYKTVSGVTPNLLSLDVYHFSNATTNKPVVVYIHGGGWATGDKNNVGDKETLFLNNNYIFVSINYRLSPSSAPSDITTWNASRVKHATHVQDCADALKWVYDNIEDYGGDNESIVMVGHSAGAHLAALLATNQSYLSNAGFPISSIKGVVANDTEGYDILDQILNPTGGGEAGTVTPQVLYQNAFGIYPDTVVTGTPSPVTIDFPNTSAAQSSYATASPLNHVSASTVPMLVISRGTSDRRAKQSTFYNALLSAGISASKLLVYPDSTSYTHAQINQSIGSAQDPPLGKTLPSGLNNVTTEILNWVISITPVYASLNPSAKLRGDVQQGWHSAIVEMIDLDLSTITGDPADVFYFTNQIKPDDTKIQWKGNIYEPIPIITAGYEKSTTGQIAQPTLTVANVLGTFTQVINSLDDLVGAKVTRRRTLGKYLDGEIEADPLQEFPIDVFYIERKTQENSMVISWELASVLDLEGLKLPRRIITQNYCQWRYRSSECGYTGSILYGGNDRPIDTTGLSAQAIATVNASRLVEIRERQKITATNVRDAAIGNKNQQCEQFVVLEARFSLLPAPFGSGLNYVFNISTTDIFRIAYWDNVAVKLGEVYRQGRQVLPGYYEIERWGIDATACSIATAELATAEANLVTATNNLIAAQNASAAAFAALPADDPLRLIDVCGKRLESCKLRFPYSSLPFGGFPGANTVRR